MYKNCSCYAMQAGSFSQILILCFLHIVWPVRRPESPGAEKIQVFHASPVYLIMHVHHACTVHCPCYNLQAISAGSYWDTWNGLQAQIRWRPPKQPRTSVGHPKHSRTHKAQFGRPLYVHFWTYIFGRTVDIQKRMYKSEWHPPTDVKSYYEASNNGVNWI